VLPEDEIVKHTSASPGRPCDPIRVSRTWASSFASHPFGWFALFRLSVIVAIVRKLIGQKAAKIGTKGLAERPDPTPLDTQIMLSLSFGNRCFILDDRSFSCERAILKDRVSFKKLVGSPSVDVFLESSASHFLP
jgi:hypothetical protein